MGRNTRTYNSIDYELGMNKTPYTACSLAKTRKASRNKGSGETPTNVGEVLSVDYQGKINPPSVRGYTGYYIFKDLCSKYLHVARTSKRENSGKNY